MSQFKPQLLGKTSKNTPMSALSQPQLVHNRQMHMDTRERCSKIGTEYKSVEAYRSKHKKNPRSVWIIQMSALCIIFIMRHAQQ